MNDRVFEVVKTIVLMEPTLFKTFELVSEIEEALKMKEAVETKKRKELVYLQFRLSI